MSTTPQPPLLRLAYGPLALGTPDDWPLYQHNNLRTHGYEVVPFGPDDASAPPQDVDATIWHSLEYAPVQPETLAGYRVALVGDWHVHDPHIMGGPNGWHLIAGDLRYTRTHTPPQGVDQLWYRQFSFDPRLHMRPGIEDRPVAVAFAGRDAPGRQVLLARVSTWAEDTGRAVTFLVAPYRRGEEAALYQDAQIVLGDAQRGELQMRAYEAMACGALYVCQRDAEEIHASGAPIPTYQLGEGHLEAFLEAWLTDAAARQAVVQQQHEWVQRNRPVDHLHWLCDRIRERLPARPVRVPIAVPPVPTPTTPNPTESEQRPEVCALVPATARRILDLGCSTGGLGWRLKRDRPGIHVTGIDALPSVEALARARLDEFYAFDLDTLTARWGGAPWYQRQYDAIVCADVLEHLRDPWAVVGALRPLLAPGGVIVASIPNVRQTATLYELLVAGEWKYHVHDKDEWRGPHDNVCSWEHLRFFTRKSVQRLWRDAGYQVTTWRKSEMSAPMLDDWTEELAVLLERWAGDVRAWCEEATVIQWLTVAQPCGDGAAEETK